jgi:hypothetical protein
MPPIARREPLSPRLSTSGILPRGEYHGAHDEAQEAGLFGPLHASMAVLESR